MNFAKFLITLFLQTSPMGASVDAINYYLLVYLLVNQEAGL